MLDDLAEEPDQVSDADVTAEEPAAVSLDTSIFYRIFHLACGRKYFTVDQIKEIIDTLAANDYTHLELAFGNGGLRFLLNDMSVTANGTTYGSSAVKEAIEAGNVSFAANDGHGGSTEPGTCLTEAEMDAVIAYAENEDLRKTQTDRLVSVR